MRATPNSRIFNLHWRSVPQSIRAKLEKRRSPLRPGAPDLQRLELPASVVQVSVPTTIVWGLNDHALLPGLLDGLEQWVPALRVRRVADASHWIVHEQPEVVRDAIVAALRGES